MIIDLTGTTSSEIASALLKARRNAGSPAMGMVGTIVVVGLWMYRFPELRRFELAGP